MPTPKTNKQTKKCSQEGLSEQSLAYNKHSVSPAVPFTLRCFVFIPAILNFTCMCVYVALKDPDTKTHFMNFLTGMTYREEHPFIHHIQKAFR